jgi:hypothetical protein
MLADGARPFGGSGCGMPGLAFFVGLCDRMKPVGFDY